ncbi:MAG: molybdopterin-binding protein, partial [Eubacterium sp.]|nr:molybdopterin-binding protein [Eubacterium sp.]
FKKGHIVKEEDIEVLLSVGKENLYVWENNENVLHEDEAAFILKDICIGDDSSISFSEPSEGKIEIISNIDGLLKVNTSKLNEINSLGEMMIATIHGNFPVRKGDKIAGTRIIPLVIEKDKMNKAKEIMKNDKVLSILPFKDKKYGIVTTGSEVYKGLIEDKFGPVIKDKMSEYNTEFLGQRIVNDDCEMITNSIMEFINDGADIVLCSGGMSVDPDDRTPKAIKDTGANIISYGVPTLPGAMLLVAYYEQNGKQIPIVGLPGCVMYQKRTAFDLVLPRLLADDYLNKDDISRLGEGGMCLGCNECHFPNCGFGK